MQSIERWLNSTFCFSHSACNYHSNISIPPKDALYLIVPCAGDKKEIPVFILEQYLEHLVGKTIDDEPDYISVALECQDYRSSYSTFNYIIRDTLSDCYVKHKLVPLQGKDGDTVHNYWGTKVTLFSDDLKPLMMCTWLLEKRQVENSRGGVFKNYMVKPLIRISPDFFLAKQDNVSRFILKNMIPKLLQRGIDVPSLYGTNCVRSLTPPLYTPTVIIEDIPFQLKRVSRPSISTTNESLLQLALDNLDDLR